MLFKTVVDIKLIHQYPTFKDFIKIIDNYYKLLVQTNHSDNYFFLGGGGEWCKNKTRSKITQILVLVRKLNLSCLRKRLVFEEIYG